ncbi:hypothetical protein [Leptolyngbya sp. 'hensonii']|nr:hypothetical protein [Leptolyngbya sp. 'hensonii']
MANNKTCRGTHLTPTGFILPKGDQPPDGPKKIFGASRQPEG